MTRRYGDAVRRTNVDEVRHFSASPLPPISVSVGVASDSRYGTQNTQMLQGLITAFRTLTIFPLPGRVEPNHKGSLPFFPLVGLALGFLLWAISLINRVISGGGWPMGLGGLMLLVSIVSTRSLHLDGLADLADAVGGGWDRAQRLEIMKDTHLGVFGAVAVIVVLLFKWLAFSRLVTISSTVWVIPVLMISRTMQVHLAVRLDYARPEGGTAASFVHEASGYHFAAAYMITIVAALVFGPLGLAALAVAEIITWAYGAWCRKNIGGITGDLLGAGNEIIEVVLLFFTATLGNQLSVYTGWGWVFS